MKYLKTYNKLFEMAFGNPHLPNAFKITQIPEVLPNDMIHEIKDICLELEDVGYMVRVDTYQVPVVMRFLNTNHLEFYLGTTISIHHRVYKRQNCPTLTEVIERIKDYVRPIGYQ